MMNFKKGDIIENLSTSLKNPYHYSVFIGWEDKVYKSKCVAKVIHYDGSIGRVYAYANKEENLKKYDHMNEYDYFVKALKGLGKVEENND